MIKKLLITALLLAAAVGGFVLRNQVQQEEMAAINTAPVADARLDFTLSDLQGEQRNFNEWDGKSRIVNFWATWCAPCRREIPLLKEAQEKHGDSGLQIVGVAVDFIDDVKAYAIDADFNYPILIGQEDAMKVAESSGIPFIGLPFTLIVSADGQLLGAHMGEIHAEQIDTIVDQFAKLDRGTSTVDEARAALKQL